MKRMTLNAAELDKFIILNSDFDFHDEILEQASQHEPWSKIVEVIKSKKPVLVFDTDNIELYVGNTDEDSMYLTALYNNNGTSHTLSYNKETDQLTIESVNETFISEDNVKTLFGNQSIIGAGNIDLYRHYLEVSDTNGDTANFEFISSSNINATGSDTKLKDLLKCSGVAESRYYCYGFKGSPSNAASLYWPGSATGVILLQIGNNTPVSVATVKDVVETI